MTPAALRASPPMALLLALAAPAFAQDHPAPGQDPDVHKALADMKERVDELEDQQAKLLEQVGGRAVLQAYTARNLDFGGHVSSLFSYMHGDEGNRSGHVVSLLELYLKAHLDDNWSVFATPGFYLFNGALLNDPATVTMSDPSFISDESADARIFLSRLEAQWRNGDALQVTGGVIGSPHGTTNREYFIPARTIAQGSLHTRMFLNNALYPQQIAGVRASGKQAVTGSDRIEYDVYFGAQDDSPDHPVGGARIAYEFADIGLSVAANYGRGRRPGLGGADLLTNVPLLQSPFPAEFNGTRDYEFGGLDVYWRLGDFISKSELYYSGEDGYRDQRALSTEWTWFASPKLGLSYRFDYYDRGSDQIVVAISPTIATMPFDLGHATEHVFGICYDPRPSVRLRLDLHHLSMPKSDDVVDYLNLSWSLSF